MGRICWDFPLLGTGNEQGYTNSGIETFKGKELIENLAREICQNSLDAKDPKSCDPVKVKFQLKNIPQTSHSMFAEYKECIAGCKANWNGRMDTRLADFISEAEDMMSKPEIPVLIASDYNTKGLEGVNAPQDKPSPWRALAHSDGTSVAKSDDSAGSYGIGKNAPFACTSLSMVFYNTYAIDGGRAFQGSARLATILRGNKKTQGVGHYLYFEEPCNSEEDEVWRPIIPTDNCSFQNEFQRKEHGTDIIVVGFSETDNWTDRMMRAVIANFFLAIYRKKLIVEIQDKVIDSCSLGDYVERLFKDVKTVEQKSVYEWYQALTDPDNSEILRLSILEDDDVSLYIKTNSEYHNRVAYFRSSGMRIRIAKPICYQNFCAVVVIEKEKLNKILREAEPVRHNKWDAALIKKNKELKALVKDSLEKLDTWLRNELRKKYESTGSSSQDSGEGDYLPDEAPQSEESQAGDDLLRVVQKIGKTRVSSSTQNSISAGSAPGTGTPSRGDVYGKKRRRKKKHGKKIVSGKGSTQGTVPSHNGSPLSAVNLTVQKTHIINQDAGLYRVVFKAEKDHPKVVFSFYAVGEDEDEDLLAVQKYAYNGITKVTNTTTVGPLSVEGNKMSEIFVTFEQKEKMRLYVTATEVK